LGSTPIRKERIDRTADAQCRQTRNAALARPQEQQRTGRME
jgi:hypothetical protein